MRFFIILACICMVHFANATDVKGRIISDNNGIKVLKVWGTHYERGFAQGFLLADQINDIYNGYMSPFMDIYLRLAKMIIQEELVFKIKDIYHQEAEGVIAGMQAAGKQIPDFDSYDLLLSNSFLDVIGLSQLHELRKLRMQLGCSVLMSWGKATKKTDLNGGSVVTRHLDWPANRHVVRNQVMVIHHPAEKDEQKWVMVGFAGQISVLSGFNKNRYCAFLNMMNNYNEDIIPLPPAPFEPVGFTLRNALEKKDFNGDGTHDIKDFADALSANRHGYAEGFLISVMGPAQVQKESTAFIAELAPTYPYITFRSINRTHRISGSNLYSANSSVQRKRDNDNYCRRYIAVVNALGNGTRISSERSWQIMRSHSTLKNNIQMMQYEPSTNTLKLAVWHNEIPAFMNEPITYNLDDFFEH